MEQVTAPEPELAEVAELINGGRLADANALFDRVIVRMLPDGSRIDRAGAMVRRAVAAWRLGRIPLALELAAEGWTDLDGAQSQGPEAAQAIGRLGYLVEVIGRRAAALDLHREAVRIARAAADEPVLAHCLQRLGGALNMHAVELDPTGAQAAFAEARTALSEGVALPAVPRVRRALVLGLARSLTGLGQLTDAENLATGALRESHEVGSIVGSSVARWLLGTVALRRGEHGRALDLLNVALAEAMAVGDSRLQKRIGVDLAEVAGAHGDQSAEVRALRVVLTAARKSEYSLQEGLGQALEQRRVAVHAQRAAAAAQKAAARDPLTSLPNRRGLEQAVSKIGFDACSWLAIVDIDHFKQINDRWGHATGDAVLREIAKLIRQQCRSDDVVARWAGDEFVVVIIDATSVHSSAGLRAAERVRAAVADYYWSMMLNITPGPTVSIGVARGPGDLQALFAAADVALYRAKRSGRNRIDVYGMEQ